MSAQTGDPEPAAVAAVRAELAALGPVPVPARYSARWAAALAAEAAPTPLPAPTPLAPRRRAPWVRPAAVAAAVLGALIAGALRAGPVPGPAVDAVWLAAGGRAAIGATDAGALADPDRRAGCLRALAVPGVDPGSPLVGGRRVEVDGRSGVLLVLPAGPGRHPRRGVFRVLVVDPGCGPGGGALIADGTVGG